MGLPTINALVKDDVNDSKDGLSVGDEKSVPSYRANPYVIEDSVNSSGIYNSSNMGIFLSNDPDETRKKNNIVAPLFKSNPNKDIRVGGSDVIRKKTASDPVFETFIKDGNFRTELEKTREELEKEEFTVGQIIKILPIVEKRLQDAIEEIKKVELEINNAKNENEASAVELVAPTLETETIPRQPLPTENLVLRPKIFDIRPRVAMVVETTIPPVEETISKEEIKAPSIELDELRTGLSGGKKIQEMIEPETQQPAQKNIKESFQEIKRVDLKNLSPSLEKSEKMFAVSNIYDIFTGQRVTATQWSAPSANTVKEEDVKNEIPDSNLATKNTVLWKDSLDDECRILLSDIDNNASEKDIIIKYVHSYASAINPSSWSNVGEFDTDEIINNPNDVYGLTHDPRLEVSKLITNMIKIALAANENIAVAKGLTVHILYEEVRTAVASANIRENN